jgi:hypothetical protein
METASPLAEGPIKIMYDLLTLLRTFLKILSIRWIDIPRDGHLPLGGLTFYGMNVGAGGKGYRYAN